jgi:PHD/YefM family antitoxin component YafN of YafNO toxin-antitoxin module
MKYRNIMLIIFALTLIFVGIIRAEESMEKTRLVVTGLVTSGAAEKTGVIINDVLTKYDGKEVSTRNELNELKNQVKSDSVEITVIRDGKEIIYKIPKGPIGAYLAELLPDLKLKEDAVVIEGIPKLGWETGKINSFIGAVELVANHLGIKKDYVEIDGISGAAFRLHFCKDWCPSSPDPTCGYNSGEAALNALGLVFKTMHLSSDGKNKPAIKKAIMASIDKNIPVIAIDLIDVPEWGVITGYQNNGEELLCRTYFDKRNSYEIAQKFPWALYIITGTKPMANDISLYKQSFKTILANLTTKNYGQYFSGINAFEQWIEHLANSDFANMDTSKFNNAVLANSWIFDRLAMDRGDAVTYLESVAVKMPEISQKLTELAKIYRDESKMLQETKINIPNSNIVKSSKEWTQSMRQDEITLLQQAEAKEVMGLNIWQEIIKEK